MEEMVCICGAGTMGRGITLAVAQRGIPVILYDLNPHTLSAAASLIEKELQEAVAKKRISEIEKQAIDKCISFRGSVKDCIAPIVIEAIVESPALKSALFTELAKYNTPATVYATNTSSLSVTTIAEQTSFPESVIGLHFFNPANRMQLVEIIKTTHTSEELIQRMAVFAKQLNKTAVICQDAPGFIVNHVARPFYLEALRLAEESVTDMESIDRLMESAGFKLGPFRLMDLIGNDINYTVSCSLYEALNKPARLKPSVLQEANVRQGKFGKKTGSGFYQYPSKHIAE